MENEIVKEVITKKKSDNRSVIQQAHDESKGAILKEG